MAAKTKGSRPDIFEVPGVTFNLDIADPKERIQAFLDNYAFDEKRQFKGFDESLMREHLRVISAKGAPDAKATFELTVPDEFTNRMGNLHGGAMAMIFDMCTTMAMASLARRDFWWLPGVSRSLSVSYLRPAPEGTETIIECEVLQAGGRLATIRGVMKSKADGKLLGVAEHTKASVGSPGSSGKL